MAGTDFFLVIDGITGESADGSMKDKKAMDIESFSWGVSNSGSFGVGGGGGSGKSVFQDLQLIKQVDKGSTALAQSCATGKHYGKATLHVRKAGEGQKEYYTITLTDVLVSSFQAGGSNGQPIVMDSFSLNYAKIEWEYKTQDAKGAMVAGGKFNYDVKQNKA